MGIYNLNEFQRPEEKKEPWKEGEVQKGEYQDIGDTQEQGGNSMGALTEAQQRRMGERQG